MQPNDELQNTLNKINAIAYDLFDYLQEENPALTLAYRKDCAIRSEILMDYLREMDSMLEKSK